MVLTLQWVAKYKVSQSVRFPQRFFFKNIFFRSGKLSGHTRRAVNHMRLLISGMVQKKLNQDHSIEGFATGNTRHLDIWTKCFCGGSFIAIFIVILFNDLLYLLVYAVYTLGKYLNL